MTKSAIGMLLASLVVLAAPPAKASLLLIQDTADLLTVESIIHDQTLSSLSIVPTHFAFKVGETLGPEMTHKREVGAACPTISNVYFFGSIDFGEPDNPSIGLCPVDPFAKVGHYLTGPDDVPSDDFPGVFFAISGVNVEGGSASGLACFRTSGGFGSADECQALANSSRVPEPSSPALFSLGLLRAGLTRRHNTANLTKPAGR